MVLLIDERPEEMTDFRRTFTTSAATDPALADKWPPSSPTSATKSSPPNSRPANSESGYTLPVPAQLLDGKALSDKLRAEVAERTARLIANGITPASKLSSPLKIPPASPTSA